MSLWSTEQMGLRYVIEDRSVDADSHPGMDQPCFELRQRMAAFIGDRYARNCESIDVE
jgi:hypothetical protein